MLYFLTNNKKKREPLDTLIGCHNNNTMLQQDNFTNWSADAKNQVLSSCYNCTTAGSGHCITHQKKKFKKIINEIGSARPEVHNVVKK